MPVRVIRVIPAALVSAVLLYGQTPGISPDRQPDYQALSAAVRTLRRAGGNPEVDKLISESAAGIPRGEARRKLANAWVMLKGGTWDQKQEYQWSLALRPDTVVADSSLPLMIRLRATVSRVLQGRGGFESRPLLTPPG